MFGQVFGLLEYARRIGELWRAVLAAGDQHNINEYMKCCDLVLCLLRLGFGAAAADLAEGMRLAWDEDGGMTRACLEGRRFRAFTCNGEAPYELF